MKVCHIITRMILGGAQENTLLTCEGLAARGHEVTLVTGPALGPEGELLTRARAGGYRVIVLDSMRREIAPLRDWRCERALVRLLRELAPDVVHTHSSKAGILGRRAAWRVRGGRAAPKIVHTIHGLAFDEFQPWWRRGLYAALERKAALRTDAILSVAGAMTAQALAAGVGRPDQYTTIYSGMEVEAFLRRPPEADEFRRSLGLPAGAVLVTQVARLAPMKGHEFLLQAAGSCVARASRPRVPRASCPRSSSFASSSSSSATSSEGPEEETHGRDARGTHGQDGHATVHFCFVGDGALRGWIEREIARLSLADRFHLTGLLPPERMPAVFHAADIVAHCSLREGLARTIPQAMLASKPVIAFDIGGAREVIDPSTGVLLAPRDVAGLRAAIEKLAASPAQREALGVAGRERCRALFDHNRMVDEIERVYRRLIG